MQPKPMSTASPSAENPPAVGIIMGSDSDWPTMKAAATVCERFGISYEARVVSAHRTPKDMAAYGEEAHQRGLKVIIAGAGGAAHLPGMIASHTLLSLAFGSKQVPQWHRTPCSQSCRCPPESRWLRSLSAMPRTQAYWPYPYSDLRTPHWDRILAYKEKWQGHLG